MPRLKRGDVTVVPRIFRGIEKSDGRRKCCDPVRIADFIEHPAHRSDVALLMRYDARLDHSFSRHDAKIQAVARVLGQFLHEDPLSPAVALSERVNRIGLGQHAGSAHRELGAWKVAQVIVNAQFVRQGAQAVADLSAYGEGLATWPIKQWLRRDGAVR